MFFKLFYTCVEIPAHHLMGWLNLWPVDYLLGDTIH